jgi:hypothetical protein
MTLPRDILTGKMPRVYDSILSRGGVLIPMQQDMAGNVLAHYPDGSTLAGTPTPGVDFTHNGHIPRVAGGSPKAEFDASADKTVWMIPAGSGLNMSNGGTWIACCTPQAIEGSVRVVLNKTTSTSVTRNGHAIYFNNSNRSILAVFGSTSSSVTIGSNAGAFEYGERMLVAVTLDAGVVKIYKNGTLIKTGASAITPPDMEAPLAIGGAPAFSYPLTGEVEYVGMLDGVILDAPELQAIAAQCGPLG